MAEVAPAMLKAQQLILEPLVQEEQAEFTRLLRQLVSKNNDLSRAPSDGGVERTGLSPGEKENGS